MISSHEPSDLICSISSGVRNFSATAFSQSAGISAFCCAEGGGDALEDLGEDLVEAVEQPLVLHVDRAGEVVEILRRALDHFAVERLEQDQMLLQAGRDAGGAELVEEVQEHRRTLAAEASRCLAPRRRRAGAGT